jgi:DnaJ-class molecular chaperone
MQKVREYHKNTIEICRNCGGTGRDRSVLGLIKSECPVCDGSGRVEKTTDITITVRPFK